MTALKPRLTALLEHAGRRTDSAILPLPACVEMTSGALNRTLGVLRQKGLIDKGSDLVWRITEAGRKAVGMKTPEADIVGGEGEVTLSPPVPPSSKQALLVELLQRPQGVTVSEIQAETGWQPHSVRGAISSIGRKKLGLTIATMREQGRGRVYRVVSGA